MDEELALAGVAGAVGLTGIAGAVGLGWLFGGAAAVVHGLAEGWHPVLVILCFSVCLSPFVLTFAGGIRRHRRDQARALEAQRLLYENGFDPDDLWHWDELEAVEMEAANGELARKNEWLDRQVREL